MAGLVSIYVFIFVLFVSFTREVVGAGQEYDKQTRSDTKREKSIKEKHAVLTKARGLRQLERAGFLGGRFPVVPVQRYRKKSTNSYYRQGQGQGQGKGKGSSGSKSAKGKGKGKGGYPGEIYFDDDLVQPDDDLSVDDDFVVTPEYDISVCVPYPFERNSYSTSVSESIDENDRGRDRRLRNPNRELKSSSKSKSGKGSGGKGSGGKGSRGIGHNFDCDDDNGSADLLGNGFGYGFEFGPDGSLRPRCPPGYVYYDQLPDAERPDRPGLDDDEGAVASPTNSPSATPIPSEDEPAVPDITPAPAIPATPGPVTAPETATPAPVATPATSAPSAGPPPDMDAPTAGPPPDTAAPTATPSAPGATASPSAPGATTTAPSSAGTSADATRVTVADSYLEYGFFDGTTVREPTQEELDGLYEQTNMFFTDVFTALYGSNFVSFEAENNVLTYNGPDADYPVTIDFDAAVQFAQGFSPIPTTDEVFTVIQNSDLNEYIEMYVWNAAPVMESLFYDTQRTRYDARIQGKLRRNR